MKFCRSRSCNVNFIFSEWNDMTMDMTDLKEIKKEGLSLEDMDMDFPLGIDMPVDAHTMSEDDFLDSFMDLSEFLLPVSNVLLFSTLLLR